MTPIIRLHAVTKRFGDVIVLNDLDLEIAQGETVALIGASGSGKSTLLRILTMLESFQKGDIHVGDVRYPREGERARGAIHRIRGQFGMVFQSFNLFPHMTVMRNVMHAPVRVLGLTKNEAEQRARELLQMVSLEDKADAFPDTLSGGQKQRIAIARALAMQPQIMLFDEPTSALDPELVNEVLAIIRLLVHRQGLTNIIVTHEIGFAREIAHRVCFLDKGRIVEQGAPLEILSNPRDARTRQFLGLLSTRSD